MLLRNTGKKHLLMIGAGLIALIICVINLICLNVPTMKAENFSFKAEYEGKKTTLSGTYYDVSGAEYAVLICPGFSCDRQKWRPVADALVSNGLSVLSFDYSGQGSSHGTIGFDNAKTDHVPSEIACAIEVLHEKSGVPYDHIILLGHSMGGRSILRLLYDDWFDNRKIGAAVLFSPEVNYNFNAQASLFAGTSDAEEAPWNNYNESYTKDVDIYLYGSTADDIVSDEDVLELARRLGMHIDQKGGKVLPSVTEINSVGSKITVGVTTGILHSYEMYSPEFGSFLNQALSDFTGGTEKYNPNTLIVVYISWFLALAGIFLCLFVLSKDAKWSPEENLPVLTDAKKFLLWKLFMWVPALVIMFVICCISVVMPFGSPVMNITYMGSIAGYGAMMLIAYAKGHFKGTSGRLPAPSLKINIVRADTLSEKIMRLSPLAITVIFSVFALFVYRSTMYRLMPFNARWFWLIFATAIMTVGYYVSGVENDMLKNAGAKKRTIVLYNLIQYVPLFLLVIGYLALASFSGLIGQIQNMVIMYIFCIPLGDYIKKKTGNRIYGAVVTAFLFQASMITSTALIALF